MRDTAGEGGDTTFGLLVVTVAAALDAMVDLSVQSISKYLVVRASDLHSDSECHRCLIGIQMTRFFAFAILFLVVEKDLRPFEAWDIRMLLGVVLPQAVR